MTQKSEPAGFQNPILPPIDATLEQIARALFSQPPEPKKQEDKADRGDDHEA